MVETNLKSPSQHKQHHKKHHHDDAEELKKMNEKIEFKM